MEKRQIRVAICGPSGVGKTTLAKAISEMFEIPFISCSYYNISKEKTHKELLAKDHKQIYYDDMAYITYKKKQTENFESFVTDRSYVDSIVYALYKLSGKIEDCDLAHLIDICDTLIHKQYTHIIFIPFTKEMFDTWEIEDDGKRITSKHFQYTLSCIFQSVLCHMKNAPHIISIAETDMDTRLDKAQHFIIAHK